MSATAEDEASASSIAAMSASEPDREFWPRAEGRWSLTGSHGIAIAISRRSIIPANAGIQRCEQRLAAKSERPLSRA